MDIYDFIYAQPQYEDIYNPDPSLVYQPSEPAVIAPPTAPSTPVNWSKNREYNQQNAYGGWEQVTEWIDDNGNIRYDVRAISPSDYAANSIGVQPALTGLPAAIMGLPTPTLSGMITAEHRDGLRRAGYADWANPNLTEADFSRISAGAQKAAGVMPGPGGSWQSLWDALTGSNQQRFDWDKEQYNRTLAEQIRQYNETLALQKLREEAAREQYGKTLAEQTRQYNNSLYSNLAQSLLTVANTLRGVKNPIQYANFTSGARNIYDSLFGATPNPRFGTTGFSPAVSISDVLDELGLGKAMSVATNPINGDYTARTQPVGEPIVMGETTVPRVPNPWQINPLVWGNMGDTQKGQIREAVEKGYTPSGAWIWEDFENQMQASWPTSVAPRIVATRFGSPQSIF